MMLASAENSSATTTSLGTGMSARPSPPAAPELREPTPYLGQESLVELLMHVGGESIWQDPATIEARIKMADLEDGLWPAFWTLGNNFSEVGWPACGELDILEMGHTSAIRDNVVTIVEKWEDIEALEAHLIAPHMIAYRKEIQPLDILLRQHIVD